MCSRVVIAAGGTGGHLFPALATAHGLKEKLKDVDITFIAKDIGSNYYFNREFNFCDVMSATMSKNPFKLIKNTWHILQGTLQSMRALEDIQADLVIGFGSYHSLPVLAGSILSQVPLILHEANAIPGKVNRLFSRYAEWTGVLFEKAQSILKGPSRKMNLPIRKEFHPGSDLERLAAFKYFELDPAKLTILVFGGSQGATNMNTKVFNALKELPTRDFQVLHMTGKGVEIAAEYAAHGIHACVREFEPRMHIAFQIADFLIARSGASTIAEAIAMRTPMLLIPYPHAMDNHQEYNARFIEETVQGGKVIREKDIEPHSFAKTISRFMDMPTLQTMKANLASYQTTLTSCDFVDAVVDWIVTQQKRGEIKR